MEKLKKEGVSFISFDRDALARKAAAITQGSDFAWSGELYEKIQKIP